MWLEWNVQCFLLLKHGDVLLLYICFHGIPHESNFAVIAARES